MYHFCTYFDQHYLPRGLALYFSLRKHCSSFQLWVLCMDRACYTALSHMSFPGLNPILLDDFEKDDVGLLDSKKNRSRIEYYFTVTPSLPLFILNRYPALENITYVDADLFFFADPRPVYDEVGESSIALIPHRFEEKLRRLVARGRYNVGFLYLRRDRNGLAFLNWWRNQCLAWCYDRLEGDRFADQKYLDRAPELFDSVTVIKNIGANLAPWNVGNYKIAWDHQHVRVDDQPLLFYHFHGFRRVTRWLYDPNLMIYRVPLTKEIRAGIYQPYIETLSALSSTLQVNRRSIALHVGVRYQLENAQTLKRLWTRLNQLVLLMRLILRRRFLLWINGRVL